MTLGITFRKHWALLLLTGLVACVLATSITPAQDLATTSTAPAMFTLDTYALRGPSDTSATLYVNVYPISSDTTPPATLKDVLVNITNEQGALAAAHDYQTVPSPNGQATIDLGDVPLLDTISVQVLVQTPQTVNTQVLQGATAVTEFALNSRQVLVSDFKGYGAQMNQNLYGYINWDSKGWINTAPRDPGTAEADVKDMHPGLCRIFLSSWAYSGGKHYNPSMIASFYNVVKLAQQAGAPVEITWVSLTRPGSLNGDAEKPYIDADMHKFADTIYYLLTNPDYDITAIKYLDIQNEPSTVGWLAVKDADDSHYTFPLYKYAYQQLETDLAKEPINNRDRFQYMGGGLVSGHHEQDWYNYMSTQMDDLLDGWSEHIYWNYYDPGKISERLDSILGMVQNVKNALDPAKPLFVTEYGVRGYKSDSSGAIKDVDPYKNNLLTPTIAGYYKDPSTGLATAPINETNVAAWEQARFNLEAVNDGEVGLSKWDFYHAQYDFTYQDHSLIGYNFDTPQGEDPWTLRPAYYMEWLMDHTTAQGWQVLGFHGSSGKKMISYFHGPQGALTVFGLNYDYGATAPASIIVGDLPPNTLFNVWLYNANGQSKVSSGGTVNSGPYGFVDVDAPNRGMVAVSTTDVGTLP